LGLRFVLFIFLLTTRVVDAEDLPAEALSTVQAVLKGDYDAQIVEHQTTKSKTWLSVLDTALHDLRRAAAARKVQAASAAAAAVVECHDGDCLEFPDIQPGADDFDKDDAASSESDCCGDDGDDKEDSFLRV